MTLAQVVILHEEDAAVAERMKRAQQEAQQ